MNCNYWIIIEISEYFFLILSYDLTFRQLLTSVSLDRINVSLLQLSSKLALLQRFLKYCPHEAHYFQLSVIIIIQIKITRFYFSWWRFRLNLGQYRIVKDCGFTATKLVILFKSLINPNQSTDLLWIWHILVYIHIDDIIIAKFWTVSWVAGHRTHIKRGWLREGLTTYRLHNRTDTA